MARQSRPEQALQHIPKKWAVTIIVAMILYALLQPLANSRLGWKLPSLAGSVGSETPADPATKTTANSGSANQAKQSSAKDNKPASSVKPSGTIGETAPEDEPIQHADEEQGRATSTQAVPQTSSSGTKSATPTEQQGTTTTKEAAPVVNDPSLKFGLLKDIGRETYVSPAGLQYTRGSEEGHRLKHLERHLKDIPDRPGKHGVFDGDMTQVLRWIDDAYTRGQRGAKGVTKRTDDGRTIYEAPFTKPIGYIGGRDGKRANHPDAKRLRLVVEGNKVITAFPF